MSDGNKDRQNVQLGGWGKGLMGRLHSRGITDPTLCPKFQEPVRIPSNDTVNKMIGVISDMMRNIENEIQKREEISKTVSLQMIYENKKRKQIISQQEKDFEAQSLESQYIIQRIYEENKQRKNMTEQHAVGSCSFRRLDDRAIRELQHSNAVQHYKLRQSMTLAMSKQTRDRMRQYAEITERYIIQQAKWNKQPKSRDDKEQNYGSNRYSPSSSEVPSEKRNLSMQHRITRSMSSARFETESQTPRDPAYFEARQASIICNGMQPLKNKYVNTNNKLTLDNKPQKCQDVDAVVSCPQGCNCCMRLHKHESNTRPWNDMEKFIFLNGYFNHPKDFLYIANTLTNRDTQDVIDFYYTHKRGMYTKLLLKVQLLRWKAGIYDTRPLILAAAYGIGLPIPREVLNKDYMNIDIGQYIRESSVTPALEMASLKCEDQILCNLPDSGYRSEDNESVSPEMLTARKKYRDKHIESILESMGVDLKNVNVSEEKQAEPPKQEVVRVKRVFTQQDTLSSEEEYPNDRKKGLGSFSKKKIKKSDEDY